MSRVIGGVLVLLLATPVLWAEDKPREKEKDRPAATPAEQYKALLAEYQKANKAFMVTVEAAKTTEERIKLFREKNPRQKFAPRFVELAQKNPKDPVAVDALIWVVTGSGGGTATKDQARAVDLLIRDHVQSDKLGQVCQSLSFGIDQSGDTLLRTVLEKNKDRAVQAEACLALAQRLQQKAANVQRIKGNADLAKAYETFYGKELTAALQKSDPAKLEAESANLFKTLTEKYLADLKVDRLKNLCRTLSFSGGKGAEVLLRTLLEKDSRRDIQGVACLSLAQVLKQRADQTANTDAPAAKKVRQESEKLFERAADKYADVKEPFGGTVGTRAKSELFDLRFLSVGQKAPEVEGEDQDGKKFKLSDYKGKVVFLDFWSQY